VEVAEGTNTCCIADCVPIGPCSNGCAFDGESCDYVEDGCPPYRDTCPFSVDGLCGGNGLCADNVCKLLFARRSKPSENVEHAFEGEVFGNGFLSETHSNSIKRPDPFETVVLRSSADLADQQDIELKIVNDKREIGFVDLVQLWKVDIPFGKELLATHEYSYYDTFESS